MCVCVCIKVGSKKRMKIAEGVCFNGLIFIDETNDPTNSCECRLVCFTTLFGQLLRRLMLVVLCAAV